MTTPPEDLPVGGQRPWLASTTALSMNVPSEMPGRIFRFEDYEDKIPNSPLMDMALDVVEIMSKSGLTTIPHEPTDSMIDAGIEVSGVTAEQVRAIFKAMLAASDEDGLELSDLTN